MVVFCVPFVACLHSSVQSTIAQLPTKYYAWCMLGLSRRCTYLDVSHLAHQLCTDPLHAYAAVSANNMMPASDSEILYTKKENHENMY